MSWGWVELRLSLSQLIIAKELNWESQVLIEIFFLETLLTSKMQGWDTRVRRGEVRGKGGGLHPQRKEYERQKVRHYSDMKLKVSKALLGC